MDPTIAEEREALECELQRLEALLGLNASWQALCLLRVRSGDAAAASDPDLSAERGRLEAALAGNRVFQQRTAVARALAAIDVQLSEVPVLRERQAADPGQTEPVSTDEGPATADPEPPSAHAMLEAVGEPPAPAPVVLPAVADKSPRTGEEAPLPASLVSRLRRVRQTSDFDGARYAAYRSEIGEASVEIVRRDGSRGRPDSRAAQGR
jgi:hypothetical protein